MAMPQAAAPAQGRLARVHPKRILIVALIVVVLGAAASLFGWDVSGWLEHVWNTVTSISLGYLLAGIALITIQTTATAVAWLAILRFAYPEVDIKWVQVLACYATAVALELRPARRISAPSRCC